MDTYARSDEKTKRIQMRMKENRLVIPGIGKVVRLGMGSWYMGDDKRTEKEEINALITGIKLGMNLIDTAEMYGSGRAESLIGKALSSVKREEVTLVSKVYPHNADKKNIFHSCEQSLKKA